MTTHYFSVIPGSTGPVGADQITDIFTNIRQLVSPAGAIATWLARFTGTYTAIQTARLSQAYYDLTDAGLFDKLDALYVRGSTEADSLLNWVPGGNVAVNNGADWASSEGFNLNGSSAYVDLAFAPSKFTLSSGCVFARIDDGGSLNVGTPLMGRKAGSTTDTIRLYPNYTASTSAARLNSITSLSVIGPGEVTGLWSIVRTGDDLRLAHNGVQLGTNTSTATALPPSLAIGCNSTTFGNPQHVSAMGYGSALTVTEQATLSEILSAINRTI